MREYDLRELGYHGLRAKDKVRVLKASHIIEAIIRAISPKEKIMISPERKAQQLKNLLV